LKSVEITLEAVQYLRAYLGCALIFCAALAASPSIAQQPAAPAPSPGAPAIQIPQVQTPTITNVPPPAAPGTPLPRELALPTPQKPAAQPPAPAETTTTNEFQDFVAASIGRQLPLFGYNLFRDAPSTFAPVENIPVTADYIIGPGDELLIRAWGQIDVDYRARVDRNGTISIPRVGVVPVSGIRYQNIT